MNKYTYIFYFNFKIFVLVTVLHQSKRTTQLHSSYVGLSTFYLTVYDTSDDRLT